jgi:hypothetical protein
MNNNDVAASLVAVKFLRSFKERKNGCHEALKQLQTKYKINNRRHTKHNNLILLKYDMLSSSMHEPIVQECRGLIIDEKNDYAIVAMPYTKFFNIDESCSAIRNLDFATAQVYEKTDGSLCTLYYYAKNWYIASSGVPDGNSVLHNNNIRFDQLFWDVFKQLNYSLPKDKKKCYMFELITPRNVIFIRHERESIILHGVRDLETLQEYFPEQFAEENNWECAKSFTNFTSAQQVIDQSRVIDPMKCEGFIICDAQFNRVKVKSPQYVALSHLTTRNKNVNVRLMLDVVRTNEGSEFLSYFKLYEELYHATKRVFMQFVGDMHELTKSTKEKLGKETVAASELNDWLHGQGLLYLEKIDPDTKHSKQYKQRQLLLEILSNDIDELLHILAKCDVQALYLMILAIGGEDLEKENKKIK